MQAIITINDDVIATAIDLASKHNQTLEEYLSFVTSEALEAQVVIGGYRDGVPFLRRSSPSKAVTPEMIERLQEEIGE
jgi:hypothetical protein